MAPRPCLSCRRTRKAPGFGFCWPSGGRAKRCVPRTSSSQYLQHGEGRGCSARPKSRAGFGAGYLHTPRVCVMHRLRKRWIIGTCGHMGLNVRLFAGAAALHQVELLVFGLLLAVAVQAQRVGHGVVSLVSIVCRPATSRRVDHSKHKISRGSKTRTSMKKTGKAQTAYTGHPWAQRRLNGNI